MDDEDFTEWFSEPQTVSQDVHLRSSGEEEVEMSNAFPLSFQPRIEPRQDKPFKKPRPADNTSKRLTPNKKQRSFLKAKKKSVTSNQYQTRAVDNLPPKLPL